MPVTNFPRGVGVDAGTLEIGGGAVTATAAEINAIAGGGLSATELGYLDAVVAGTAAASKAAVLGTNKNLDTLVVADGGLKLGAAAGTAITATAAEINLIDGSVAGTAVASKALSLGADKNVDTLAIADSGLKLGAGAGTAVTKTAAQLNLLTTGVAGGYMVARGETALDGGNPTPVATGLTAVVAFTATLKGTAAPGAGTSVLTADISGTTVNVYAWKPTTGGAAGNPDLVASTGTESFYWVAVGT